MPKLDIDILSDYYRYELAYLRSAGEDFSARFPKIARRLDLSRQESSDPHVERLIESFAFLTGKLQKQIDDQFPEIANALLDVIYKPLVLPIPSAVMVKFDVDIMRAKKNIGMIVPRHTLLKSTSFNGAVCSFMTSHDMQIWPIEIVKASIVSKEQLPDHLVRTLTFLKLDFHNLDATITPSKLRFYILADTLLRGKIFAGIFSTDERVILQNAESFKPQETISPIGVEDDEALFFHPNNVHKGFHYLHEYFAFPDKFYGFDVTLNETLAENFSLYIPIGVDVAMEVSAKDFSLSTVPAVNLFPKISEPLRLDHKQVEYFLSPDYRLHDSHEIYCITKMVAVNPVTSEEIEVPEFYSCNHFMNDSEFKISWVEKRKEAIHKNSSGDDIFVSFVDENFNPECPADQVFYAYTLCTNRHLAEDIPVHGQLQSELSLPVKQIYCVNRPTQRKNSLKNGEVLWKLISLLSLNSLSFFENGVAKLKELLHLFSGITDSHLKREIDSIQEIQLTHRVKRVRNQTWYGFANGADINLTFDENLYNHGLPLSLVISKFLSSYTTINTFADVYVRSQNGVLKKWETQFGMKPYL